MRSPLGFAQHFADNPDEFVLMGGYRIRLAREKRAVVEAALHQQNRQRDYELARIDEQLLGMNEQQFEATYSSLPPNMLQQLRDRRTRLGKGSAA